VIIAVSTEECEKFALERGMMFMETSSGVVADFIVLSKVIYGPSFPAMALRVRSVSIDEDSFSPPNQTHFSSSFFQEMLGSLSSIQIYF
jgi:hypothetical protein